MKRKSFELLIQGLYTSMSKDILVAFPSLRRDVSRDLSRLLSAVSARSTSFFTIDLPAQGKHFDKCLASGLLTRSALPHHRGFAPGSPVPRLFRGLYLRVFHRNGVLRVDPDVTAIRYLRQLFYCCKKFRMEVAHERKTEVIRSFFQVDSELRRPSLSWEETVLSGQPRSLSLRDDLANRISSDDLCSDLFDHVEIDRESLSFSIGLLDTAQQVCDIVAGTLGAFDSSEWEPKHGPGAVSDGRAGNGYSKYSFPYWPSKLEVSFPSALLAFANYGFWAENFTESEATCGLSPHEPPSKLICVPKTQKAPRLIASEPTAHQWAQQILLSFFSASLRNTPIRHSVNFRSQDDNRAYARLASHTGSHATVDLSEASDRVSCWTVERVFRTNSSVLEALHSSRTRWVMNTVSQQLPRYSYIRKFACMGSACTFPVQSIIFACLAVASLLHARGLKPSIAMVNKLSREVRVFGDDIIIPIDGLERLKGLLGHLQLKVNDAKTFGTGKFRESCGIDAYDGHVVTPIYSMTYPEKSRPESVSSVVESSNNFFEAGLIFTATWLESTLTSAGITDVAYVAPDSGTFGLRRPFWKMMNHGLKSRFNRFLHRTETRCLQPYGKQNKSPDHSARSLLQYFTEDPSPLTPWASGIPSRPAATLRRRWETIVE